jgi:hypothetical protein
MHFVGEGNVTSPFSIPNLAMHVKNMMYGSRDEICNMKMMYIEYYKYNVSLATYGWRQRIGGLVSTREGRGLGGRVYPYLLNPNHLFLNYPCYGPSIFWMSVPKPNHSIHVRGWV